MGIHPLSIEAISPTLWHRRHAEWDHPYPSSVNRGYFSYGFNGHKLWPVEHGIHPLSIEAISPTTQDAGIQPRRQLVSILCQSRLFLLPGLWNLVSKLAIRIHPLSIEAISPTNSNRDIRELWYFVSILCQSRLFLLLWNYQFPLPILAVYPSSVNRGYFSYIGQEL